MKNKLTKRKKIILVLIFSLLDVCVIVGGTFSIIEAQKTIALKDKVLI